MNWQRVTEGAVTPTISVDNVTIENTGSALRVKDLGISTAKLAADAVTFAKMQNLTTDSLIGRDTAGTGDPESISVGGGLVFTGSGGIQTTAFTGDVTKALGGTALTLATVNSSIGTFNNITINAKGLATAGSNVAYLTSNQTITLSGDVTGSGSTAIATTLATVNANVGTFNSVTVNAKGLVTAASNVTAFTSPLTTKGDVHVYTTTDARLPIGSDEYHLIADSNQTAGMAWRIPTVMTDVRFFNQSVVNTAAKTTLTAATGKTFSSADVTEIVSSTSKLTQSMFNVSADVSCANAGDTLTITLNVVGGVAGGTVTAVQTHVITMAGTESATPLIIEAWGGWHDGVSGASAKASGQLLVFFGTTAVVSIYNAKPFSGATAIDASGTVNRFQMAVQWSTGRVTNSFSHRGGQAGIFSRGRANI